MPRDSSDNAETGRVHDYLAIYYWEVWQVRKRLFIIFTTTVVALSLWIEAAVADSTLTG